MKHMKFLLCLFACCMLCYSTPAKAGADLDGVKIGGALRVNYVYKDWDDASRDKLGDAGFELFRLGASGKIGEILFSGQYRWYPKYNMTMIHHGWIGYQFNEHWQGQLGLQQVPFGILPYASHSFWFSGQYYLGLEDDYDMGAKALYNDGPLDLALAFYKNGDVGNAGNFERYSFDMHPGKLNNITTNNEETNQGNVRLAYTFTHSDTCSTEIGASGEYGKIYNTTAHTGTHWATAAHLVGNYGPWNIQLETIQYKYNAKDPGSRYSVQIGGLGDAWGIPAKATANSFNVAYGLPVDIGPISKLTFYSDNSFITPDDVDWHTSWQNVVGCGISAGAVYANVDLISSENMIWMGGSMVGNLDGKKKSNGRNTLFNVNIGYYF